MAQVFAINGTTLDYITGSDWETNAVTEDMAGQTRHKRDKRHLWRADAMPMDEWQSLYALEGQLVDITTTNPADINGDYITFYGVNFQSIRGRQEATIMRDVACEFMVRT